MKTALQHFHSLPSPYGQMAIEETIRIASEAVLDIKFAQASDALWYCFAWLKTDIGFEFWESIYENLQHLESQSKQDKG